MKRWTVYCHTHIATGRRYIGLTVHTMMHRWNQHYAQAKRLKDDRRSHFAAAIRAYGKDAFSHEVLEVCYDIEVANLAEECWIELFETRDPKKGFNLARGGLHIPHPIRKNPWDDPDYRKKNLPRALELLKNPDTRAKSTAALNTPEGRAKRATASRGVRSRPDVIERMSKVWTGRTHTDSARAKVSAANLGRVTTPEVRAKISAASRSGSPEVRAKISAASRSGSPEVRARISAALTGIPAGSDRIHKLKSYYQARRSFVLANPPSGKQCKHHGWVSFQDCFFYSEKSGKVRLICKQCSHGHGKARRTRTSGQ